MTDRSGRRLAGHDAAAVPTPELLPDLETTASGDVEMHLKGSAVLLLRGSGPRL